MHKTSLTAHNCLSSIKPFVEIKVSQFPNQPLSATAKTNQVAAP